MQVKHGTGARGTRGSQRPPTEQRMEIVAMDDVGAAAADCGSDLIGLHSAEQEPSRGASLREPRARALEQLYFVSAAQEQRRDVRDRSLLATFRAVAVVQHQHAHCEDVYIATALLTTFLSPYRVPLYEQLAQRHEVEVLCYGGAERYVPPWFADLDSQLAAARFPARRLGGLREALALGRRYRTVIAPFAGGALLPAAYAGTKGFGRPFVLWASVWVEPRSAAHALARPAIRHIYRHADAVLAYGEHVRRFVAGIRGRDEDVFVAPQAVEPDLFARQVAPAEIDAFRRRHQLPDGPLVIFAGRLVEAKGIDVLLSAWRGVSGAATLVVIGDGPLASHVRDIPRTRFLGSLRRAELPIAYAAGQLAVVPSIPTPRFVEPWGLICNEAMHQARPVIATDTVGAVAGGLVRDGQTGVVVAAGDTGALRRAIDRLLADERLRGRLGGAAQAAVAAYTYDAMVGAFERALAQAATHKR